ncbi:Plant UBX domain-containing protein 4 [Dichanthelium oligosanthes]|uniref:Plant UBX domain-containing protein 4 n=1 Tax=Dichanthelium oligosanthes TaxID=888268 RepID=A0A1E5VAK4_9POAL|nr:Plant UBX domain-containing protein 4 [Dichanthelium oligosanthes]
MAAGDAGRAPMPADAQSLVESFCGITSATPEEAAFFLEGHNWALESAVRSYYDSADGDAGAEADAADPAPPLPPPPPADGGGEDSEDEDYVGGGVGDDDKEDEDYVGDDDGDDEDAAVVSAAAAAEERRRPVKRQKRRHDARGASGSGSRAGGRANGKGNVRTLSDLGGGKRGAGSDEDSGEDDEWAPPPEYYTGGEKSGILVRDRSKRKNNADEVFKQAKRKGAKQGPFEPRQRSSSSRNFTGTGRLLTGDTVQRDVPQPPEEIVHNIYFWSNGFTVNDGPLRSFDDPANASFLESIKNSDCPTELEPADGKSKVNVNLVRKEEEFTEPVKCAAPFQGERRTLVAPCDNNTSSAAASSTATAPRTITVDDSLPSTSLQIRFADGSRLVARFNMSHTISDVRAFIDATRPEASEYTLQAGFPPKPLEDATKTIEEAGVANSVIIQSV